MTTEGCTPIEVPALLQLRDYDLVVRCLEVVRSHLPSILPQDFQFRIKLIALCHHHPSNVYPAFGIFGTTSWQQIEETEARINAWVAAQGIDWLISKSSDVTAPTWKDLQARLSFE